MLLIVERPKNAHIYVFIYVMYSIYLFLFCLNCLLFFTFERKIKI